MPRFRKKPVVIEAEQFDPEHLPLPFSGRGDPCCFERRDDHPDGDRWYIPTLEGDDNCWSRSRSLPPMPADRTVAALFVKRGGPYWDLPGVDPWDEARDARLYAGPHPVVAHPPCSRWCRLAGLVEARWGHKKGEDGGLFESALNAVRRWGGVLEHPAWSAAWHEFGLPIPDRRGGWQRGLDGGWACYVEQGRYGHPAKKATWLYACHTGTPLWGDGYRAAACVSPSRSKRPDTPLARTAWPPPLRWGHEPDQRASALVSWCGNNVASGEDRPRVGGDAAARTPEDFRDALLQIAREAPDAR